MVDPMTSTQGYRRFTRVDAVEAAPHGLLATLHGERLRVDVVRPDLVRVKISRGGRFDEEPTHAVCVDPLGATPAFTVEHTEESVQVRTDALVLSLWLDPFRIDVHRTDGTPVVETARDAEGRYWGYATRNDAFVVRRRCRPSDAFYGLGEKTGSHDRRGRSYTLWNLDVCNEHETREFTDGKAPGDPRGDLRSTEFDPYYVSIPFFHHHAEPRAGGGVAGSFVDNGYRAHYDFSGREEYSIHFAGGQYTEYIFAGPRLPDVLEHYTWLTGRTRLPPLWALGHHQCRWFRYTQEAVEELASRYRELDVPCDVLWLDIDYMDGYRVFTWDRTAFPDPPAMLARLSDQGFRVITIIDPGVKHEPGYWVFDQAVERGVLCRTEGGDVYTGQVWPGETAFPDFATPEARSWWGELNAAHVASGIAGIWNDMNEPATGEVPSTGMRFDGGRASHERYHNSYALLMAMGTTEGLLDAFPDSRPFVLSRAGSAGIQRYAANWMGDNCSRWDHLRMSIPMGSGLGLSGQAFVGADVGGFSGDADGELFLRWTQYGVLTPFCRNHSEIFTTDQYPWSWGEAVLGHVRDAIRLRYRLLPYIYSSFVTASLTGAPVQRPLVLDHQDDPAVRALDDEYLFGPDLLVAPVVEPGQTARHVYLPGGEWYDWHTDEHHEGRSYVLAPTPMDRIPVYARAGAVVPMWTHAPPSTAGHRPESVELHVFVPRADGTHESWLCEDDGLTLAAERGRALHTTFRVSRRGDLVELAAEPSGEGFDELVRTELVVRFHGAAPHRVVVDGTDTPVTDGFVALPNAGEPFVMTLEV